MTQERKHLEKQPIPAPPDTTAPSAPPKMQLPYHMQSTTTCVQHLN
jgi:hypothetical protein